MRTSIASLACVILAFAASAGAASSSVTYFGDGTFAPGTWTNALVGETGIQVYHPLFSQAVSGGDPGDFEYDDYNLDGIDVSAAVSNFSVPFTFSGTFSSIDYSYDLEELGDQTVGYSIAISEGGNVYVLNTADVVDINSGFGVWRAYKRMNLFASSFCEVLSTAALDCSATPSFSGTTSFGYVMESSFVGFHTLDFPTGLDNYCVGLNGAVGQGTGTDVSCLPTTSTPEPSSAALCCLGGLFLAAGLLLKRRAAPMVSR